MWLFVCTDLQETSSDVASSFCSFCLPSSTSLSWTLGLSEELKCVVQCEGGMLIFTLNELHDVTVNNCNSVSELKSPLKQVHCK